jgi:hypothetical protein
MNTLADMTDKTRRRYNGPARDQPRPFSARPNHDQTMTTPAQLGLIRQFLEAGEVAAI